MAGELLLLVDDEVSLLDSLRFALEQQQYRVLTAERGDQALALALEHSPQLILLDVMLPGMDGFEVCRRLRSQGFAGSIVLLTARDEEIDSVLGLELGADDYLTKPFRHRELLARVKAHLRRDQRALQEACLSSGDVQVWLDRHEVWVRGQKVELSPKEFQLLEFLLEHRRKAQTRERILSSVWGYDFDGDDRVVKVTVQRLREKIEQEPSLPRHIVTVRGLGYRWDV